MSTVKTCLIVDDSSVVRTIARAMVEKLGFTASEAEDGLVALKICDQSMPHLVLLDWNMPNMDGLEFMKELRKKDTGRDVKVIFCTSENGIGHIETALAEGADEYIMKPFSEDIVESKIEQVGLIGGDDA